MEIYYRSVGHGSVLLLNHTPDTTGLIPEADAKRAAEFGAEVRRRFGTPIAETAGKGDAVELALGKDAVIDHIITMEDILQGERVQPSRRLAGDGDHSLLWDLDRSFLEVLGTGGDLLVVHVGALGRVLHHVMPQHQLPEVGGDAAHDGGGRGLRHGPGLVERLATRKGVEQVDVLLEVPAGHLRQVIGDGRLLGLRPVAAGGGAVGADDGKCAWTFPTGSPVWNAPLVHDGVVVIGSRDGKLYALDAQTGTCRWAAPLGGAILSSPALDAKSGRVYVGCEDTIPLTHPTRSRAE